MTKNIQEEINNCKTLNLEKKQKFIELLKT